jgi:thiol-disulfide isomerase/thioredoxin
MPAIRMQLGEPRFQDSYQAQTDAEGRFDFDRLPPVVGSVQANLGAWQESPLTSSESVPLELHPGERRTVILGDGLGTTITGKVVPTGRGDVPLDTHYSINYLVSRDRGVSLPTGLPKLGFEPGKGDPLEMTWLDDPHFHEWQATRASYFVKLSPNGALRVSGVPAGAYDLVIQLYEQPVGCLVQTIGRRVLPVDITAADVDSGQKPLGEIEVPCRVGPRVGENMQAYEFLDTEGRQRSVSELHGKYVLMHVWTTTCAPCIATLPDMKATVDALADKPIVFVGLNIDANVEQAKSLADSRGWSWNQTYLGSNSEMSRQLAVSSAPAYFLIDPDGKLIASSNAWAQIKKKIETSL